MENSFKIYYGDETIFSGRPEDAPNVNVQAIAWNDPTKGPEALGRVVLHEWDIYIYSDHVGSWHGTNKYIDLFQHLGRGCGPGGVRAVLQGTWIRRELFLAIMKRARTDTGLNRKSANDPLREEGTE